MLKNDMIWGKKLMEMVLFRYLFFCTVLLISEASKTVEKIVVLNVC